MLKIIHPDYEEIAKDMKELAYKGQSVLLEYCEKKKRKKAFLIALIAFIALGLLSGVGYGAVSLGENPFGSPLIPTLIIIFCSLSAVGIIGNMLTNISSFSVNITEEYENIGRVLSKIIHAKDFYEASHAIDDAMGDGKTSWSGFFWKFDELNKLCELSDLAALYNLLDAEILSHEISNIGVLRIFYCKEDGIVKRGVFSLDNVVESTKVTEPELSVQNGSYVLTRRYSK